MFDVNRLFREKKKIPQNCVNDLLAKVRLRHKDSSLPIIIIIIMISLMIIIMIMKQAKSKTQECYYVCMSALRNLAKRYLSHWKLPN